MSNILSLDDSLILIIDVQDKLLNAVFNGEKILKKSEIISKASNILEVPVIITEQYPKGLGNTIDSIKSYVSSTTKYFEKTNFSAINETEIYSCLKKMDKKHIVVFGIETHICVSQTVLALIDAGYKVSVIKDACGSRKEEEHNAGIWKMRDNGADIITVEIALFEWLKSSQHAKFKEIQNLIK